MKNGVIPFVDLKAQYAGIKDEIDAAIAGVLESGQFVLGDEVEAFEEEFAHYCGADFGIAVNSGTSALHLALLASGIGTGDEVITVSFTFVATVAAIVYTGATPVFVDIDPATCTLDVTQIEKSITECTKAIMPVHLYGQPADMDPIMEVARRHNLVVIEDAAQAHGAEYKCRRVGSMGDLGCFSFYPGKNLGAYGEGGMVVTSNAEHAHTIRMLRDWGQSERYAHVLKGFNYRMDGIQGAILRVKLRHLDAWTAARRAHAAAYDGLLADVDAETPAVMPYNRHVYHLYVVQIRRRDRVQQALHKRGIQSLIHYPVPVHLQEAYSDLDYKPGDLPNTEKAAGSVLSLPMHAELTSAQIHTVVDSLNTILRETAH